WSDYALNLVNSTANVIGIVAAALVLISIALIYFTGTELAGRAKGGHQVPGEDPTKALRRSQTELAAMRRAGETKTSRLSQVEADLAAARRAEQTKTSRLSQVEVDLAAARRTEEMNALRLSQVEAELATARRAEEAKASRLAQVEAELATARRAEEAKTSRLAQVEAELATAQRSEEAKTSRLAQVEAELAAVRRSEEAKTLRLAQVEAELAATQRSAEEAKGLAKQLEQKQGPRRITPEQRNQFLNAVRGQPTGRVIVSAFFDNKETHDFGAEILNLLKEDGFDVMERAPLNFFTTSRPSSGIRIGCENISNAPSHFFTVRKGFEAMGLDAPTTTIINAQEDDVVEIQVTPKQ
ncbi:MAG: hypothetical protein QOE73_737, partial [Verrucomicrobiota bacterium]